MIARTPHFLLFSESNRRARNGDWKFVLQPTDGSERLEVEDAEPEIQGERLELLTVVRGLEALSQPSRVTLLTPSRYVSRGLSYGIEEWRANGWQWERHGEMVPVKNHDLWQRLDRALVFHKVHCRTQRIDTPELAPTATPRAAPAFEERTSNPGMLRPPVRKRLRRALVACRRGLRDVIDACRLRMAQCGTSLLPSPWL